MVKYTGNIFYVITSLAALFLASCKEDDPAPIPMSSEGYYIVNEGGWNNSNTSISFYDRRKKQVTNDLFQTANGIALGDQAQSMSIFQDKGYIVVQGSGKIEVVELKGFTSITTISKGIVSPRYFLGVSASKAYVSDWGADGKTGTIKVIDLNTHTVTKTIPKVGQGTGRMLRVGTKVFAANSGGQGKDNTLKVIDTTSDQIVKTITLSAYNPNSLQKDAQGNIWVACSGHTAYHPDWSINQAKSTPGAIIQLNTTGDELKPLPFSGTGGPKHLNLNKAGNALYYIYKGAVYKMSMEAAALPATEFIDKGFYGLSVDPIDDTIIGCAAPNFTSNGRIYIHSPNGGEPLNTHEVGIGPNGCTFK